MHEKKRERYLERLDCLANQLDLLPDSETGVLEITPDAAVERVLSATGEIYESLLEELLTKDKWAGKYSEQYLDKRIRKLLKRRVEDGASADWGAMFDELVNEYENYTEGSSVFVPLAGVRMQIPEFTLGSVVIRRADAASIEEMLKGVSVVLEGSISTDETKEAVQERTKKWYEGLEAFAVVQAVAEPIRARERAIDEVSRVIDLLRYAVPSFYPPDLRVSVSLQMDDLCRRGTSAPVVSYDSASLTMKPHYVGPLHSFDINEATLERFKQLGVDRVSDVLSRAAGKLTDFEQAVLRGVHWFASGMAAQQAENTFLNWITCLETYLTPRDQEPIRVAVAEGTAIILAEGLKNRKALKKRVNSYYGMRSRLSHGGSKEILTADLNAMRVIAANMTWWMIHHMAEFNSISKLQGWLEEQRLS